MKKSTRYLIEVVGPPACGKSTLIQKLIKHYQKYSLSLKSRQINFIEENLAQYEKFNGRCGVSNPLAELYQNETDPSFFQMYVIEILQQEFKDKLDQISMGGLGLIDQGITGVRVFTLLNTKPGSFARNYLLTKVAKWEDDVRQQGYDRVLIIRVVTSLDETLRRCKKRGRISEMGFLENGGMRQLKEKFEHHLRGLLGFHSSYKHIDVVNYNYLDATSLQTVIQNIDNCLQK